MLVYVSYLFYLISQLTTVYCKKIEKIMYSLEDARLRKVFFAPHHVRWRQQGNQEDKMQQWY